MKAAILFSGGKDSCLALHLAAQKYEIKYLLSVIPESEDSWMFHKPDMRLLGKQAEMLDIELVVVRSKGEKEKELRDLEKLIKKVSEKVDVIVVGGIASSYQGKRVKKICKELGIGFYAPLWDFKGERVWKELLKKKFEIIISKISCEGLGKEWLGKIIDKKKLKELKRLGEKYRFRIDFEGGEAETAVLFMPEFKKHIKIEFDIKDEGEYRHFLDIKKVR
jgi:ABC transporter with metal-binding/Fe-S-binding domain ATP-binding protein